MTPKPKKKRDERPKAPPKNVAPKSPPKPRKGGVSNEAKAPRKRNPQAGTQQDAEKKTQGKKEGREINQKARKVNKAKSFKNN